MNTHSNAYVTKFSSGTILALLAISGLLVIVPVALPALAAQNTSASYTLTPSPSVYVSSTAAALTLTVANPATNAYAVTAFTVTFPATWALTTAGACGGLLGTVGATTTGLGGAIECTGSLPPGFSTTIAIGTVTPPASTGAAAISGTFQTSITDGGSTPASYAGPTFSVIDTDISGVTSTTPSSATNYIAGSSAIVVEVIFNNPQSGVPVTFTSSSTKGSFNATTENTNAGGHVFVAYSPPNTLGGTTATGTVAESTALHGTTNTITTVAGLPSTVLFSFHNTYNVTASSTIGTSPGFDKTHLYAEVAASGPTAQAADKFGNLITWGTAPTTCTIVGFGGQFDNAGTASSSNSATCSTTTITNSLNYFQAANYGATSYWQVTMQGGVYQSQTIASVSGTSPNFMTSIFDATPNTPTFTVTSPVTVGSSATITYTATLAQSGVKVTFLAINGTDNNGLFAGGTGGACYGTCPAGTHKSDNANVTAITNSNGVATATYDFATVSGKSVTFNVQFTRPDNTHLTPPTVLGTASAAVATKAGSPSQFLTTSFFDSGKTQATSGSASPGSTLYVEMCLADKYGNSATNPGAQLNIPLTASAGSVSNNAPVIPSGQACIDSAGGSGLVIWNIPSSATVGSTLTLTTSGLYPTTYPLSIVSPNPTLKVTLPVAAKDGNVYSNVAGVSFSGTAAQSTGLAPGTGLSMVVYSVNGGAKTKASGTATWNFVAILPQGLNTVTIFVNDTLGDTSSIKTLKVMVDTTTPTVTVTSASTIAAGSAVTFSVVASEGDLNASAISATTNSTATLTTSVSGTNNLGNSVTYTVSVNGLPVSTGHWSVTLTVKGLTGNSASATAVVKVTIAPGQSFSVSGTPGSATLGSFKGVSVNYQNFGAASQNVVVFAVWQSSAGTVGIGTASGTVASGATGSFFVVEPVGLASGTYTVNLFVWTTSNQPVSVTTTITVTV
jgi:hypothetical protein